MRQISTVLSVVALVAVAACQDQGSVPLGPDLDIAPAFSHVSGGTATFEVTVTNLTSGQPFTPPLAVTHKKSLKVFEAGKAASLGVREIAENGNLAPLAAALDGLVSDLVIAAGSFPPVLPGESRTFTITADKGAKRFSFVSMLICTNDGFTGLSSVRLPRRGGDSESYDVVAYDAGSEMNTEDLDDMVPPCGPLTGLPGGSGTGTSDPTLAEGGVIGMHGGIAGGVDLVPAVHGWTGPVATVSITRLGESDKSDKSEKSKKSDKSDKSEKSDKS